MFKIRPIRRNGLTLIELMVAAAMAMICVLAVGAVFYDSQKAWNETYMKANSAIMLDSHIASKAFEASVRKATCERYLLDPPDAYDKSHWVEVYYFASTASAIIDRYAKLYVENSTFYIERGTLSPRQALNTTTICSNVTDFNFSGSGRCIRLEMTLSKGNDSVTFISAAIPQNQ
jgi:Tfp pilus assembly protein PilE